MTLKYLIEFVSDGFQLLWTEIWKMHSGWYGHENETQILQFVVMFWRKTTESYNFLLNIHSYLLLNPVLILCQKEFKVLTELTHISCMIFFVPTSWASNVRPAVICRNSNVKLKVSTVEKAGSCILWYYLQLWSFRL